VGHTCGANNCYSGWYCELAQHRCVAPPASCTGAGGGGGTGGGVSGTGGGVSGTGGGVSGTGGGVSGTGGGVSGTGGGVSGTGGGVSGTGGGSGIGPTGGRVSLLHFGTTGDTRPPACEDTPNYPTPIINAIADRMTARGAQFVVDLGDHMYVCNDSLPISTQQMGLYMTAVHRFPGTWFMTMGNHECYHGPCLLGSQNANYVAFMSALSPIANKPYYAFNIDTSLGRATFVVIADNAWDSVQAAWLDATLHDADLNAKYTIVIRHHPEGDTSVTTNSESMQIVRAHKFALFLTGHSHLYKHMTTDNGRDLVLGTGGAQLIAGGSFYGYAMVDQLTDGRLQVSVFNLSGDLQQDIWTVGPNP
jgi:hypothetical protein